VSKSLHILSSNRVHAETGAIDDDVMTAEEIREEIAAPDAFVQWKDGALQNKRVIIEQDRNLAQGHLDMAERDKVTIREVGGVTSENLGRDTQLVSGVALKAKHDQGSAVTAELFDNLRMARQMEGELKLSLIEQFYTERRSLASRRAQQARFRGDQRARSVTGRDLTTSRRKGGVRHRRADYQLSLMVAMFASLMSLLSKLPWSMPNFAASARHRARVPAGAGKDALVMRIRELTGLVTRSKEIDPQKVRKNTARASAARRRQLNIEARQAKVESDKARRVDAGLAGEVGPDREDGCESFTKLLEGIHAALQAAQVVATVPVQRRWATSFFALQDSRTRRRDAGAGAPNARSTVPRRNECTVSRAARPSRPACGLAFIGHRCDNSPTPPRTCQSIENLLTPEEIAAQAGGDGDDDLENLKAIAGEATTRATTPKTRRTMTKGVRRLTTSRRRRRRIEERGIDETIARRSSHLRATFTPAKRARSTSNLKAVATSAPRSSRSGAGDIDDDEYDRGERCWKSARHDDPAARASGDGRRVEPGIRRAGVRARQDELPLDDDEVRERAVRIESDAGRFVRARVEGRRTSRDR